MEPRKKLKVIPIYRFFQNLDSINKALYLLLFAGVLAMVIGTAMAVEDPVRWTLQVNEFNAGDASNVAVREFEAGYRTMTTEIGAWAADVTYVASEIRPVEWLVLVFVLAQILAWAYLLTAATYTKSYWGFIPHFAFALIVAAGKCFEPLSADLPWLYNILLTAGILAPAYLMQQKMIRLPFSLRLLFFGVATSIPFVLPYAVAGWTAVHFSTVEMLPVLCFLLLIYVFFVSNDVSNLMFYLATNAKKKKFRVQFPIIFGVWLVIVTLEFLMLQKILGWDLIPVEDFPLRPMHLVMFASVVIVGTKQNMYPILKDFINNRGLSVGLTAISLLALSTIFYHAALGEYLFIYMVERLAIIFFFVTGIFHFFYIFYNFGSLIRARINFYYLSMMPKRLMYFFVVIASVLFSLALEASDGFKTQRLFSAVRYNRTGDDELVKGEDVLAAKWYEFAASAAKGTAKGNYNAAMIAMQVNDDEAKAREYFRFAYSFIPFPYAYLNHGNLEMNEGSFSQAKYVFQRSKAHISDAYVSNNLAQIYMIYESPDSAIMELKNAMTLRPDVSGFYANLGKVYMTYEKPAVAREFLELGLQTSDPGPAVVANALYLNLRDGTGIELSDSLLRSPRVQAQAEALFNYAIDRYKDRDYEGALQALQPFLSQKEPPPNAQLLEGMIAFETGKVAAAKSRMESLANDFNGYDQIAHHYLAVAYFSAGVPEMAAEYFRKSVDAGRSADLINQARMEIDRGNQEYGFQQLNLARQQDSTLFFEVEKEVAMLQLARGEYFMASIGFDPSSLSQNEWARVGRYAGAIRNHGAALEAFRNYIMRDSNSVVPYLEMGRISLKLGDSLALENLMPGMAIDPENVPLRIEIARAHLQQGNLAEAQKLHQQVASAAPDAYEVRFLGAQLKAAAGDSAAALEDVKALHTMQPLHQRTVIELSRLSRGLNDEFEAQNTVDIALKINHRNSDLWYEFALLERMLGREAEVAHAARKAIETAWEPERIEQINAEFRAEITNFPDEALE